MKNALLKWEALDGKTVRGSFETLDDLIVVVFTDGTHAALKSAWGYDGERYAPELCQVDDAPTESDLRQFVNLGALDQSELDKHLAKRAAHEKLQREQTEARERKELERLMAKYPNR